MDLYGPPLPPGYVKPVDDDSDESENDSLSKNLLKKDSPRIIGPQCPIFLCKRKSDDMEENGPSDNDISKIRNIGPSLPSSFQNQLQDDDEEEEGSYGPSLPKCDDDSYDLIERKAAIEKRAANMRNKLDNEHLPPVEMLEREEWMTVPDTSRKNQLGAISRCLAPAKSSSKEKHHHRHSEKDKKTTEELKKYNKSKRSESLLELHKKDRKKKEKHREKDKSMERKAFDRDEMDVKYFTKGQVNSVIDKAKYLNSRFAPGNNQYL